MSLKKYLILMSLGTLVCSTALVLSIIYINPAQSQIFGFVLFYSALFLSLLGIFSLVGFLLRVWLMKNPVIYREVIDSFRQSIWFALLFSLLLFLQSQRILTWWISLLGILFFALVESFFIFRDKK